MGAGKASLRTLRAGTGRDVLVCFPAGGASATTLRALATHVDARWSVHAVQYPGRGDRLRERSIPDIVQLARTVLPDVVSAAEPTGRLSLFGISMGATVAFETARLLQQRGTPVAALIVAGRPDPTVKDTGRLHLAPNSALLDELERLAPNPATVQFLREDPDLADMLLPALRSDYRAVETYFFAPGPPLTCPLISIVGDNDPTTTRTQAEAWHQHTTGRFECNAFSGGHFVTDERPGEIAGYLNAILADSGVAR